MATVQDILSPKEIKLPPSGSERTVIEAAPTMNDLRIGSPSSSRGRRCRIFTGGHSGPGRGRGARSQSGDGRQ